MNASLSMTASPTAEQRESDDASAEVKRLEPSDIAPLKQTIDLDAAAIRPDSGTSAVIDTGPEDDTGLIQSVDRALRIMELLASQNEEMRLQDIAEHLQLNSSTCHHLLRTLAIHRYVVRSTKSRKYSFGPRIIELSRMRANRIDFTDELQPDLEQLAEASQHSVYLAVMSQTELKVLRSLPAPTETAILLPDKDMQNAAHASALGKAILAWLPETQIARVVAERGLHAFTGKTINNLADLVESLRQTRRYGFAIDDEEFLPGVITIATAFRDGSGAVIGAVGCSTQARGRSKAQLEGVQRAVVRCADSISHRFSTFALRPA